MQQVCCDADVNALDSLDSFPAEVLFQVDEDVAENAFGLRSPFA